jgi:hypothetical protein
MLMTNIPIAKVTDENITIATVISHEEYLNTAILNENSNPREMINQVAALEVVCQENSENDMHLQQPLIIHHRRRSLGEINVPCLFYSVFLVFGILFLLYTRIENDYQ